MSGHEPTLLVRADADPAMGSGHVMRCLAIAQAFQDAGGRVHWLAAPLPDAIHARLEREGISVLAGFETATAGDGAAGAAGLAAATESVSATWVVIDGYRLGAAYSLAAHRGGARALVVDDDGVTGDYPGELVVDPNLFATPAPYANRPAQSRLLCGPDYALLRRELACGRPPQTAPHAHRSVSRSNVLCSFGGADPAGLSSLAIAAVDGLSTDTHMRLIVGSANREVSALLAAAKGHARLEVVYDAPNMREHLEWADLAVTAAGGTCLELAFMGVPAIVVVAADNQRRVAGACAARGIARELGVAESVTVAALRSAITSLAGDDGARAEMSRRGRALVDGRGAARVVATMLEVA